MEILIHPSCLFALSATHHRTSQLRITSPSTGLGGSMVAPKATDAHSHPLHATLGPTTCSCGQAQLCTTRPSQLPLISCLCNKSQAGGWHISSCDPTLHWAKR